MSIIITTVSNGTELDDIRAAELVELSTMEVRRLGGELGLSASCDCLFSQNRAE